MYWSTLVPKAQESLTKMDHKKNKRCHTEIKTRVSWSVVCFVCWLVLCPIDTSFSHLREGDQKWNHKIRLWASLWIIFLNSGWLLLIWGVISWIIPALFSWCHWYLCLLQSFLPFFHSILRSFSNIWLWVSASPPIEPLWWPLCSNRCVEQNIIRNHFFAFFYQWFGFILGF